MEEAEPLTPGERDKDRDNDLRLENDILRLKLQAEFGAQFDETSNDVAPEIEQRFLKQVYDFEKAWERQELVTVRNLLGNPLFKPLNKIPPVELPEIWQTVLDLYTEKGISIDFNNDYPLPVKYQFATEELPEHETMFVNMPGMMLGFIYEEFHPNYASDMEEKVRTFLQGWFEQDVNKCGSVLSNEFILDNGIMFSKEKFIEKLTQLFDSIESIEDPDFFIAELSYDKQDIEEDEQSTALGYVEGAIRWKAAKPNGEIISFAGPFKFYLECNYNWWTIMFFQLPGWKW